MQDNKNNVVEYIDNLAPITNGENQEIYVDLLKKGIKDNQVKNIALSGSYGSGKSSIIQNFLSSIASNENDKYLEISLANFDDNADKEDEEQHIEKSILQQIFYKVSKSELPYSKLDRTEKKSKWSIFKDTIGIFIWLVSFYTFIKPTDIQSITGLQDSNIQTFITLNLIIFLISTFYFIYKIIKGTGKIRLNKLSFQGATLEIDKNQGSLINQHLDEILYFFEATNYEVLIIEDLDRQDGTKIFQKLREINTLLNNYTKITKKITFIYAVKDSIFTGEERTKFFEFIIPVVPIINTSNAKDVLITKFTDIGILKEIGKDFLKDISYYIHNYRQLTNMINEFCVYQDALKNTQDYAKLFSLIVYKNFFPKDFSDLQSRKGNLYDVFHSKQLPIKKELISKLNDKVKELNARLKNIKNENIDNERELRLVFASKLFEEVTDLIGFYDNDSFVGVNKLVSNDELFNKYVIEGGDYNYYYHYHRYNEDYLVHKNIKFKGDELGEYEERLKILKDKVLEKNNKISQEKDNMQKDIREIKYEKLQQLLERLEETKILDIKGLNEEDITNWKLVKKMIIDGYIDEDYSRYISYFHEGGLTRNDYDFIINTKEGDTLPDEYNLNNAKEVIEELSVNDFKIKIENISIAEYIFMNDLDIDKRKYFIAKFFDNSKDDFMSKLIEKNILNSDLISTIIKEASQKKQLNKLLKISKTKDRINKDLLSSIINNLKNINMSSENKKEFNELLSSLLFSLYENIEDKKPIEKYLKNENVTFDELTDLNYEQSKELFNFIYQNSLYSLSYENIKHILIKSFGFKVSEEIKLKTNNFTAIKDSKAKYMLEHIDKNINLYFKHCLGKVEANTKESEETFLYFLNHEKLDDEHKHNFIEKTTIKVENITSISNEELWGNIFKDNKIEASWNNIMSYYLNIGVFDNALIDYLNVKENADILSEVRIDSKYREKNKDFDIKILKDIIESSEIELDSYESLIKNIGYWYVDLDISNIDEEKIILLIKYGKFQFKKECFNSLKEHTSFQHISLIEKHSYQFLEKFDDFTFDASDILKLMDSSKFTQVDKYKMIEKIDIDILGDSKLLREKVSKLYIDDNKYIDNNELFKKLFYDENNLKMELLISQIGYCDCNILSSYLKEFGKPYNELLIKSYKKLDLKDENINILLLEKLQKYGYISSFSKHKSRFSRKKELRVQTRRGCN